MLARGSHLVIKRHCELDLASSFRSLAQNQTHSVAGQDHPMVHTRNLPPYQEQPKTKQRLAPILIVWTK